jgi:hypothetical protein
MPPVMGFLRLAGRLAGASAPARFPHRGIVGRPATAPQPSLVAFTVTPSPRRRTLDENCAVVHM